MPDEEKTESPELSEDPKVLRAELERARKEAADRRVKVRSYEEADERRKEEERSKEEERARKAGELEKVVAELKAEKEAVKRAAATEKSAMKKRLVDEAIRARLTDAIDPDISKLIDRKNITVDDETFELSGVDDTITAFRALKPQFFGSKPAAPAATNSHGLGPKSGGPAVALKDYAKATEMSIAQVEAEIMNAALR